MGGGEGALEKGCTGKTLQGGDIWEEAQMRSSQQETSGAGTRAGAKALTPCPRVCFWRRPGSGSSQDLRFTYLMWASLRKPQQSLTALKH